MSSLKSRAYMPLLRPILLTAAFFWCCSAGWGWQSSDNESVEFRIIVVSSKSDAQKLLQRLKRGADFAALAKEKSTDSTAADGGYMGNVDPTSLRAELRDALKDLQPGATSGIIKLPSGFAILKMLKAEGSTGSSNAVDPNQILPLSARGSIRYSANVAGAPEADAAYQAYPKPEGWDRDLQAICQVRRDSLGKNVARLQDMLESGKAAAGELIKPLDLMQMRYSLGQLEAYQGHMDKAIAAWELAYKEVGSELPAAMPQLEEALGTAYLHKSEMENGLYHSPGERCLFPPATALPFKNLLASRKAVQYLTAYLKHKPDDLEGRWLLNLSYMTEGKYPAGVPQKYLIPPAAFQAKQQVPRFVDVAPAAGLNLFSMAGGIIVDDFDNDGLLDVMTSSYNVCEHMHFFHNNGDGTFSDRYLEAGLAGQLGGLNIMQADYNNDGCMDVLVTRGGWQWPMRPSLLKNNCDGTFTDVTQVAGLTATLPATQTAAWADIDNDGLVDLFLGNERGPGLLYRNQGDGTFEDISHSAGVDKSAFNKAVVAADYDNDGYMDFYVSNLNGDNFLYHNNRDRTFTEVAHKAGVEQPWTSFPAWFFDFDNDGWPDLFVASYYMSVDEVMRSYLGKQHNAETLKLYRNMGDGAFKDVTAQVGLDRVLMPMGANFGDIDNDGFLDMYLGNGNPSYTSMIPHVLYRNQEGTSFVDVTSTSGTGDLHKGHGVAFADIDQDGDEDILTVVGGAVEGDAHAFRLFENPGAANDWISLRLVGVKTNRAAIGARIKVTVRNRAGGTRSIYRTVSSGGSFGASPMQQHIGLGKSARSIDLEIWWPVSNTRQTFSDVAPDQFLEIRELAGDYSRLQRRPYRLGGARSSAVAPLTPRPSQKPSNKH